MVQTTFGFMCKALKSCMAMFNWRCTFRRSVNNIYVLHFGQCTKKKRGKSLKNIFFSSPTQRLRHDKLVVQSSVITHESTKCIFDKTSLSRVHYISDWSCVCFTWIDANNISYDRHWIEPFRSVRVVTFRRKHERRSRSVDRGH